MRVEQFHQLGLLLAPGQKPGNDASQATVMIKFLRRLALLKILMLPVFSRESIVLEGDSTATSTECAAFPTQILLVPNQFTNQDDE